MRILVLHNGIRKPQWLIRSLRHENVEAFLYDPTKPDKTSNMQEHILAATAIIIYFTSHTSERVLKIAYALQKEYRKIPFSFLQETPIPKQYINGSISFDPPFDFKKIATHIKHMIYKKNVYKSGKPLRYVDLFVDPEMRMVKRSSRHIPLRNKEFALLEFFMLNRGKILTRDILLEHVWDRNNNILSNTVDVHVNSLRRKIDGKTKHKLIHTVHCVGYKFDAKT